MTPLPDPSLPWPICLDAVALIAECEGLELTAYKCPAGVWTLGRGETENVHPGDVCTQAQADQWLCDDLTARIKQVNALVTCADTSPNELGALCALAYNIGVDGLAKSTVLRAHNAGDRQSAARAFDLWNKAKDPATGQLRELPGLTARRKAEAALYLKPAPGERTDPMPQAVAAETPLHASPINRAGAVALGAGVLDTLSQAGDALGGLSGPLGKARSLLIDTLGVPAGWILPLVLVGVGAAVIWWRAKQRGDGWA